MTSPLQYPQRTIIEQSAIAPNELPQQTSLLNGDRAPKSKLVMQWRRDERSKLYSQPGHSQRRLVTAGSIKADRLLHQTTKFYLWKSQQADATLTSASSLVDKSTSDLRGLFPQVLVFRTDNLIA